MDNQRVNHAVELFDQGFICSQAFKEKNETVICRELLGCGMAAARERGLFHTVCRQ